MIVFTFHVITRRLLFVEAVDSCYTHSTDKLKYLYFLVYFYLTAYFSSLLQIRPGPLKSSKEEPRGTDSGVGGLDPLKICRRGQSMF